MNIYKVILKYATNVIDKNNMVIGMASINRKLYFSNPPTKQKMIEELNDSIKGMDNKLLFETLGFTNFDLEKMEGTFIVRFGINNYLEIEKIEVINNN
jgi:hypothetical protein